MSRHRQSAVSRNFIWTSSGNSPFEQIPSEQATAIRCLRKPRLNEQRQFAAHRNCARASTGTLPLGEIALVRASAFRCFKKFRLGKENPIGWRPLLSQWSSTRTGFYGKSSGQGKPERVEATFAPTEHRPNRFLQKLRSGEENPIEWKPLLRQRRTSAYRGIGKLVSGIPRLAVEAEIRSANDFGLPC